MFEIIIHTLLSILLSLIRILFLLTRIDDAFIELPESNMTSFPHLGRHWITNINY